MILFDSNILFTFSKIEQMSLLTEIFEEKIAISPEVENEIYQGATSGYEHCDRLTEFIQRRDIKILRPKEEEIELESSLPNSLGSGEKESLAIAKIRGLMFITNDKRAINYCKRNDVNYAHLNHILRLLWKDKILSKNKVKELIEDIERRDTLIITDKQEIFKNK